MAAKEGEGGRFGPRVPAGEALEEARVPALRHEGGLERARLGNGRPRESRSRHEGIVERVDEEGGPADARKELSAAGARPVVLLVGEAVKRGRDEAIVLGERLRFQRRGQV